VADFNLENQLNAKIKESIRVKGGAATAIGCSSTAKGIASNPQITPSLRN
jgi:hypothetical protein